MGGDTHISKGGNAISIKYSNTLGGGDLSSFINAGFKKKKKCIGMIILRTRS